MYKTSYHKYDIFVFPKSEVATEDVLKVCVDGDDTHRDLAMVEIANHLRKIYSDEFEIVVMKEIYTGSITRKEVTNWDLFKKGKR